MATSVIIFGSMTSDILAQLGKANPCSTRKTAMVAVTKHSLTSNRLKLAKYWVDETRQRMKDESDQQTLAFAGLEEKLKMRREGMGPQKIIRKGRNFTTRSMSISEIKVEEARVERALKLAALEPKLDHEYPVSKIEVQWDEFTSAHCAKLPSQTTKTKKRKPRALPPKERTVHGCANNITKMLIRECRFKNLNLEIISTSRRKTRIVLPAGGIKAYVTTKHMQGLKDHQDFYETKEFASFARCLSTTVKESHVRHFKPGDSGLVYNLKDAGYSILRGRIANRIVDAREWISHEDLLRIEEFSAGSLFWKGYEKTFAEGRQADLDHECKSVLPVVECGEVAGMLTQIIFPCGRITCDKCVNKQLALTRREYGELVALRANKIHDQLAHRYEKFPHVVKMLTLLKSSLELHNPNNTALGEIFSLIGDRTEAPFSHINFVSRILQRCGEATPQDFSDASQALLEIARFNKNRTDVAATDDIKHFRNKISAKSRINLDLMCDNQLDKNGNFMWGERGYHAKRFFSNYFEIVDTETGYQKHILRKVPNGIRKLAIGELIVTTNFQAFRERLEGERVHSHSVGGECVSKRNGSYVYSCCCVTTEHGQALESGLELPTKHHLVIGNSGDAKYVGLPQESEPRMYIAKEGYCYINLFLAMLINVSESDAKAFTKMVRDVMIPKLGKWPQALEVATACYMLSVFFPDTKNAELPRILVDHTSKTMHVLDSFGSISTGYHILKASTVSQFMNFALSSVESELKFYTVGGKLDTNSIETIQIKQVIRGIYKPKIMKQIIEEEPFMLILALLSPSVLMSLFSSGSLERATQHWIHKNQTLAQIFVMLSILATRVSIAKTLQLQVKMMEDSANCFLRETDKLFLPYQSINSVNLLLMRMVEDRSMNAELDVQGFREFKEATLELVEKNYVTDLEVEWFALSWRERLCSTIRSYQLRARYSKYSIQPGTEDLKDKCSTYLRAFFGHQVNKCKNGITHIRHKCTRKVYSVLGKSVCASYNGIKFLFPEFVSMINTLVACSVLLGFLTSVNNLVTHYRQLKNMKQQEINDSYGRRAVTIHKKLCLQNKGINPTEDEFIQELEKQDSDALKWYKSVSTELYDFQAKSHSIQALEKVIAFIALILMTFDAERSDGVARILGKFKQVLEPLQREPMKFQSIDEMKDLLDEKRLTIDFEIDGENTPPVDEGAATFSKWWSNQLQQNNVMTHYRTEGHFMEFTRANAANVANEIAHGTWNDLLVRGAVGSGKSTGLPFHLSQKGRVLVLEPTRPLAENVYTQLKGQPFLVNPTLRMRGNTVFGTTPITIMTSGYALHYFANNVTDLKDIQFVLFDECHVHDASAMAFRCLLKEYSFEGKIIKVSATPPGREAEFSTQKAVALIVEQQLSFSQFVQAQGSGSNCDVLKKGNNILVYVASYNEVDTLSKLLIEAGHKVTKVDGRTMKSGAGSIETHGTDTKKHFVVATNIIENGVTLDIDVVVDFGTKVVAELDMDARMMRYQKRSVSYGERIQRLGRVGRVTEGTALRIGETEKGIERIPAVVATEAAFFCFAYGLPVMTENVSLSFLSNSTVLQARTMLQFELPIFYTVNLVRFDGTVHPAIYSLLKKYKLRDSETVLNKLAIPVASYKLWNTTRELHMHGQRLNIEDGVRIPFHARDIPEELHEKIDGVVRKHKADAGFGKISSFSAAKIAYTLQTDPSAIQRTILIIEKLIESEVRKQAYYANVTSASCTSSNFTLTSIINSIRSRHMTNYTAENISVLHAAKSQLMEFRNIWRAEDFTGIITEFGALECMHFQSQEALSRHLGLKGMWNKALITGDVIVTGSVIVGGIWMIYEFFKERMNAPFEFQAKNKRQRQKLKFRDVRDNKYAREVHGEDADIEHYFGSAYTKKGKGKGTVRGMGIKNRRFINMYGFDPTEYSFARYVDPLTGQTLDESVVTDLSLVQDHFGKIRTEYILSDKLEPQQIASNTRVEAYFVKDGAKQILKIDLTPHNPLQVGDKSASIAGHPDRELELRQTGRPSLIDVSLLPQRNEEALDEESVEFESKSTFAGVRDYNPISTSVCHIVNTSDGHTSEIHGIGFGPIIITNQHLFRRNNGELRIRSHHGEFLIKNTTTLKMFPIPKRDIILIRMPKDFPPFPMKLRFREAERGERVCMVGSNFQTKSISSTISETSVIAATPAEGFYKHWISTKDGQCGLPIVSVKDGYIIGIHSLASSVSSTNMLTSIPEAFESNYLEDLHALEWVEKWKLNVSKANWGAINIKNNIPEEPFKISKEITSLDEQQWAFQDHQKWLYQRLEGNLKAVAQTSGNLVTKHVVRGKCVLFQLYLETHPSANEFFRPLMGFYQKSALNKEAYVKDFLKYSSSIVVGEVDCKIFEESVQAVITQMREAGFTQCNYITDEEEIFQALNMKAAVGALYQGKKRDYFKDMTDRDRENILEASCLRLYKGLMGIWNGSLKAELRPKEKVMLNKTRSFTAAPIDTLLGGKVCVDDFNNKFYSLNMELPSSVGMTKFYGGWNKLLGKLPEGWVYCDADGSQFDSSLSPYLINAVLAIRTNFMEDWDIGKEMLNNLYTEIVYTPIATPDGTIVKKFKGNNSGQPSTVVDNTIMVMIAMKYALLSHGPEFVDKCKYFINGDDLIIAVEPSCEYILDVFSEKFQQLGLNYNFSSRTRNKDELWFMSHAGLMRDEIYIPKLEQERIVSILEWDRATEPAHRLEAICASMIEAWGYDTLLLEIRKFYFWVLEQAPYNELSKLGYAPYISEVALKALYTGVKSTENELERYLGLISPDGLDTEIDEFEFQADESQSLNAGREARAKQRETVTGPVATRDEDVNVGTPGTYAIPKLKSTVSKLSLPRVRGKQVVNLEHLLIYEPEQVDISNARSTHAQFAAWYDGVKGDYDVSDAQMEIILNGLMVWCVENGTSPNINGMWVMMDGLDQVEYPLKPVIDHAKPTLRQVMAHFSSLAEAYIEKRNTTKPYMPRYGLQRNLTDMGLARYAFDFYEMTSKTPARAKEAHMQMKAAALRNTTNKMFGLDGNVGTSEEDTERHTAQDVSRNMHTMLGVRM
ncbi:polyprotein [Paris potyvirus 4]|nr:polyprotein [Paris potyvirus 4]